ncbi:UDP-glycosyltransferase UGT5-like [Eurosta solidaginis]|uniref:UDP-glycosyltransferase UGT5-like n=1 Tax=Eurosta solidaginis TaxID=178769 RepID=UPI003530EB7A
MHIPAFLTVILINLLFNLDNLECAKILSVFPFTGPSQYLCVQPYLHMLAARGHQITSVSAFPQKTPIKNFRDVVLKSDAANHDEIVLQTIEKMSKNKLSELHEVLEYSLLGATLALKSAEFQQLLRTHEHFDLIIIEVLNQDALYPLGQHFKAPIIGISTFGTNIVIDQLADNISPIAYLPTPSSKYLDSMTFWQRLHNLYDSTMELIYQHLVIIPAHQQLYETYFPNATLTLSEIRRNFSLVLLNQHYSLSWPRPYMPNVIEVAGMHIEHKPKKLPTDMEAFINGSPNGAIYFSLGSNVKSALLPRARLDVIMAVFASLPVNVLWKYENPKLPGKPQNVFISKWFPQTDILAHPKVKLFITHGGMHSYIEAVHYGKPIVVMPVFFDQHSNAARAKGKGLGLVVDFSKLTKQELHSAILELLNNPMYTAKAQEISAVYHDRPMSALDTAIFWTEYILKYKGAPHLRVTARQLNFFQRNSVDTMIVLFGIPLLIMIFIIVGIYKLLISLLFSRTKGSVIVGKNKCKKE